MKKALLFTLLKELGLCDDVDLNTLTQNDMNCYLLKASSCPEDANSSSPKRIN